MSARPKPRLLQASYFVWIIVPAILFGIYQLYGLPHMLLTYSWQDNGLGYSGPISARQFTRCSYVGPSGWKTIYPANGSCGLIRFFKTSGSGAGAPKSHRSMHRHFGDCEARGQLLLLNDLEPHHAFQNIQHGSLINNALRDLGIAMFFGLHGNIECRDFPPELIVVQRFQPLFNVFSVFKTTHAQSVHKRARRMQIWSTKADQS